MNPIIRGWMTYDGKFHRTELDGLLRRINTYLVALGTAEVQAAEVVQTSQAVVGRLLRRQSALFAHWTWMTEF